MNLTWWQFEFARPTWLVALAALPVLVYFYHRSLSDFARWQRICSLEPQQTLSRFTFTFLSNGFVVGNDPKKPLEVLRVVHSFDPCLACTVHVIDVEGNDLYEVKV